MSRAETLTPTRTASAPADDAARLAAILDGIGDSFYAVDRDWRITFVNRTAEAHFGRSREQMLGRVLWDVFADTADTPLARRIREAMASGTPASFEAESVIIPGRWIEFRAFPTPEGLGVSFRDVTERHRAQEELERSRRDLEDFFENGTVGLHWVASDGTVLRANRAELDLLGYAPEDYVGRHIAEFHADDAAIADILARLGRGECLDKYPARLKAKDGSIKHVLISSNVQFRNGRFEHTRCFTLDVTEKRAAEAALRESEERYRLATEAFQGGVSDHEVAADVVARTPRHLEIIGEPPDGLAPTARAWFDRIHPDDVPAFVAARRPLWEEGASHFEAEYRVRHRDGHWVWVWHRAMALRDQAGRLCRIVSSLIDVTERKRVEGALRETEEKFRQLADNIPTLCWMADADGWIFWYNKRWYDYTGTTPADMEGWGWQSVHDPEVLPEVLERWKASIASGTPFEMVFPLKRADGRFRPFLTRIEPFRDAEGRIVRWFGTNVDITEQRAAAKRQKLMINELNHRVKNTLAIVQSIAAQSFRGAEADPRAREAFEARLLALSKAHDVLTRESWEGADLQDIVRVAVAPYLGTDESRFGISGPPLKLPPGMAVSLAMALHELATNASKYGALSRDGGRVCIAWEVAPSPRGRNLRLRWEEKGGPPVEPPGRSGFGTRLIERGLARELGGSVGLAFEPHGVVCTMDALLPAPEPEPTGPAAR